MNLATNSNISIASVRSCMMYDQEGVIRVVHEEVTLQGGQQRTGQELQRMTRDLAQKHLGEVDGLEILLHDGRLEPGVSYRVNITEKSLIQDSGQPAQPPPA